MHAMLAMATGPDLSAENLSLRHLASLQAEIRSEAAATAELAGLALPSDTAVLAAIDALVSVHAPSIDQPGLATRVHGDYHLGQVLRSAGGFVITDFEGEPARPLAERRQRQSPLVDAAGMVRSFDYAGQAAGRARPGGEDKGAVAAAWTEAMVAAFLSGYWKTAEAAPVAFLPAAAARMPFLHLLELRKALYELRYELNNRPDWADIPIASIIRLGSIVA
jgi:maltose alpha-D-glucosyltransferase/alpha-amylase